jgi:repressor LexA
MAGQPPTVREVQVAFGYKSVESARMHLDELVRDGLLTKTPGKSRSYRLAGAAPRPSRMVPLLGHVQAGKPSTAIEEVDEYLPVDSDRAEGAELFALRVHGDSMIGVGILPDDIVVVRRQPEAAPGDIVVALVTGIEPEATVKTLRRRNRSWYLEAANPKYEPIVPEPSALRILGKVIEVRRLL